MRVLVVHNYYQHSGGEDRVFEAEVALLRENGHTVSTYTVSNADLPGNLLRVALNTIWARDAAGQFRAHLRQFQPDVVHVHNTFMQLSPAIYYACKDEGVPVVQSLHNPRLLCPAASLRRDGAVCENCVGKAIAWDGILHGCYRGSRAATGVVASMLTAHKLLGTWKNAVDRYIVFTEFYYRKFAESGVMHPEQLVRKPHFIAPDPQPRPDHEIGEYALFIGRLDPEKGVQTMLSAWDALPDVPLKIRGGGQLAGEIQAFIEAHPAHDVDVIGRLSRDDLTALIKGARCLIWASEGYYETFGLVAAEALSCGVPVIASKTGVMEEIVVDGVSGVHFEAGNAADLARMVKRLWHDPALCRRLGRGARQEFEQRFTAERNYQQLLTIYDDVIAVSSARRTNAVRLLSKPRING